MLCKVFSALQRTHTLPGTRWCVCAVIRVCDGDSHCLRLCSQRPGRRLQHQRRRPEDLRGLRKVVAVDHSVSPDLYTDVHVPIQSVMLRETIIALNKYSLRKVLFKINALKRKCSLV